MKKALISLLSALLSLTLGAQDQASLLRKIDETGAEMKSVSASFTQTRRSALLAAPAVSKGTMLWDGSNLRWAYDGGSAFIIRDGAVFLSSGGSTRELGSAASGNFRGIARIMALSSGGLSQTGDFDVSVQEAGKSHVVSLRPLRRELSRMFEQVRLYLGTDLRVSAIELLEPSGDSTLITLSDVRYNLPLRQEDFR